MIALDRFAALGFALLLVIVIGCGRRTGGVIQETREFTFDEIAAAAATETAESDNAPQ